MTVTPDRPDHVSFGSTGHLWRHSMFITGGAQPNIRSVIIAKPISLGMLEFFIQEARREDPGIRCYSFGGSPRSSRMAAKSFARSAK